VVYDDGAHSEGTQSVGEGVEGVVGDHGDEQNWEIERRCEFGLFTLDRRNREKKNLYTF
jgi:hypothetical protein